jgi:hypothetical protein
LSVASAVVAVTLSAAASGPVRLAAPGLASPNLNSEQLTFYTEHLAQQLLSHGLDVVTAKDINSLLSMERQKELLGCTDQSGACMAELANALGVDAIVNGEIARVGTAFQINLKVIAAGDGKRLATYSARASSEEGLLDKLNDGAAVLTQGMLMVLRPELDSRTPLQRLRPVGWVGIALGGVGLVAGVVSFGISQLQLAMLMPSRPISLDAAATARDSGKLTQTLGWVGVATGAVLLAAGVTVVMLGAPNRTSVTLQLGANGRGVQVSGAF